MTTTTGASVDELYATSTNLVLVLHECATLGGPLRQCVARVLHDERIYALIGQRWRIKLHISMIQTSVRRATSA